MAHERLKLRVEGKGNTNGRLGGRVTVGLVFESRARTIQVVTVRVAFPPTPLRSMLRSGTAPYPFQLVVICSTHLVTRIVIIINSNSPGVTHPRADSEQKQVPLTSYDFHINHQTTNIGSWRENVPVRQVVHVGGRHGLVIDDI